jgi:hypothetical protein
MGRPGSLAGSVPAVIALAMLVAGCAPGGTTGPSPTPADTGPIVYATGPTDLVLQVSSGGGLLPQAMLLAEMPDVSIYGDGRVVRLGSHRSGSQDPLLPELIETRIKADGMARILSAARDAGLLGLDRRFDLPGAYDLWTAQFTVTANGATHRVSVFGLGFEDEGRLAPSGEMAARRTLAALYGRLVDLRAWLPSGAVGPDSAYEPTGTRVFMTRLVDWPTPGGGTPAPASPAAGQEIRDWPIADLLPESFGKAIDKSDQWYCAAVGSEEAVLLGLDTATKGTRWRAAGWLYQLVARPLLPDESGCPASV